MWFVHCPYEAGMRNEEPLSQDLWRFRKNVQENRSFSFIALPTVDQSPRYYCYASIVHNAPKIVKSAMWKQKSLFLI